MTYEQSHHRPREEWGTWCEHGKQLTEPDPESRTYATWYPEYRLVEPWPCDADGCTREALEASWDAIQEAYLRDLEREAYDAVAGADLGSDAGDWR